MIKPLPRLPLPFRTDSYKHSHHRQVDPNITHARVYGTCRWCSEPWFNGQVKFFGLQHILASLTGCLFTREDIEEAAEVYREHFGQEVFNKSAWERLFEKYEGRIPVHIRAIPEGLTVPLQTALFDVTNTDPEFPWIVGHIEGLLMHVWLPTTVATYSMETRKLFPQNSTFGQGVNYNFHVHDFGFRGAASEDAAMRAGAAHLLSFEGTDNNAAMWMLRKFYGAERTGYSVPAAEHWTISSWGRDNEAKAYEHILNEFPEGLVSIVADTYDFKNAVTKIFGRQLKDKVLERNGVLVIRPDSGEPVEIVRWTLEALFKAFGSKDLGFNKLLHDKVRIIQGDGIDYVKIKEILQMMKEEKWDIRNVVFGQGGALVQKHNRDTLGFAIKGCQLRKGEVIENIYKDPQTSEEKASRSGRPWVVREEDGIKTYWAEDDQPRQGDIMQTVFRDGEALNLQTFGQIKAQ